MTQRLPVKTRPTSDLDWDDAPGEDEVRWLEDRLDASIVDETKADDTRPLAIVARDARGSVVGGIHGVTWGGCCELVTLWVDRHYRRRGVATRLLVDAEAEARTRACSQVVLFTHSPRPPSIYVRLGYDVVGVVPDYPQGSSAYWLRKQLTATPKEEA